MVNEMVNSYLMDSRSFDKILSMDDAKLGKLYKKNVVYNKTDKMKDSILNDKISMRILMLMGSLASIVLSFAICDYAQFVVICIELVCLLFVFNNYSIDRSAIYGSKANNDINLQTFPIRAVNKIKMSFNGTRILRPIIQLFNDVIPGKLDNNDNSDFQFSMKSANKINSIISSKDCLYSDAKVGRFIKIIAPLAVSVENGTELDSNSYTALDDRFEITESMRSIL